MPALLNDAGGPVNNPAGGERTRNQVGELAFVGFESSLLQSAMGKATYFILATDLPASLGGVPLVIGEPYYTFDPDFTFHYGDYVSGPMWWWFDESGYWSDGLNGGYAQMFVLDWGDGSPLEKYDGGAKPTHVYATNGTKTVTLWSYLYIADSTAGDWTSLIPTDYTDPSLWTAVQQVSDFSVVANDGPTYHGYSGASSRFGLSLEELNELGSDSTYAPQAALLTVPWSQIRTGTDSGPIPETGLSPAVGRGLLDTYWPGELVRPMGGPGFDIGFNNDLSDVEGGSLPDVSDATMVKVTPPSAVRSTAATTYYEHDSVLGFDGTGRLLISGTDPGLPFPIHYYDDAWPYYYLSELVDGDIGDVRIYADDRLRTFLGGVENPDGTWTNVPEGVKWRGVYSDDEVLVEVGDRNLFVVNISTLDVDGQAVDWYLLTNLKQHNLHTAQIPRLRAGGGFWIFTPREDIPTQSVIAGIGRDGALETSVAAPSGSYGTFDPQDFPTGYGYSWSVFGVIGDPADHDLAYVYSSYTEPDPDHRASSPTGYDAPIFNDDNRWIRVVKYVSVVFRIGGGTPEPALWLEHPHWFSEDGQRPYIERVRVLAIGLTSAFWTDSVYTGGHWAGDTGRVFLTIPPLRQWPRDDGLRRNPGRTAATSRQGSLRRGPRGTYT